MLQRLRNVIVYNWDQVTKQRFEKQISPADIQVAINKFLAFLSNGVSKTQTYTEESLLKEIDPSGLLWDLYQMEVSITIESCQNRVAEALNLWKNCQTIYQKSQNPQSRVLIEKGLGIVFGVIGNAVSKLIKESRKNPDVKAIISTTAQEVQTCSGCSLKTCNAIDIRFRHLNRIPGI